MRITNSKTEIVEQTIDDLIDSALFVLETSDTSISAATGMITQEADQMLEKVKSDEVAYAWFNSYIDHLADVQQEQFRFLYKQGARDCVEALRKLGVIK